MYAHLVCVAEFRRAVQEGVDYCVDSLDVAPELIESA